MLENILLPPGNTLCLCDTWRFLVATFLGATYLLWQMLRSVSEERTASIFKVDQLAKHAEQSLLLFPLSLRSWRWRQCIIPKRQGNVHDTTWSNIPERSILYMASSLHKSFG
jgi:hypothetical protein